MRPTPIAGVLLVLILFTSVAWGAAPPGYKLVWADEFNGDKLDTTSWGVDEAGYWDGVWVTEDAVSVEDGNLVITTYTKMEGGQQQHYASVVGTKNRHEFTYGYFEARIQFRTSPGAYSAFWIMSPTIGDIIGDPEQSGTEIDIVEHRAVNSEGKNRQSHVYTAVHWDGYGKHHESVGDTHGPFPTLNAGEPTWNTYAVLWTPTSYTFYFDGQEIWQLTGPISQTEHYLLFSTLIDSVPDSWAGRPPAEGYGSKSTSNTKMLVDWVRVYQHAPEPGAALLLLGVGGVFIQRGRRSR